MSNTKEIPLNVGNIQQIQAIRNGDKTEHRLIKNFSDLIVSNGKPLFDIGDKLWLQEEWRVGAWNHDTQCFAIDYKASPDLNNTPWLTVSDDDQDNLEGFYKIWAGVVDELNAKEIKRDIDGHYRWPAGQAPLDWRSAESMPRWASRTVLEVTAVRDERIQDIDGTGAYNEGCPYVRKAVYLANQPYHDRNAVAWFFESWKRRNGEQSVLANCRVTVLSFKVVERRCDTNVDRFNKPVTSDEVTTDNTGFIPLY